MCVKTFAARVTILYPAFLLQYMGSWGGWVDVSLCSSITPKGAGGRCLIRLISHSSGGGEKDAPRWGGKGSH